MRILLSLLLLTACGSALPPLDIAPVEVETVAVQLDPDDAARSTIGQLAYRGGIELRSKVRWFGGLSALRCAERCIAVGDAGIGVEFALVEAGGRLLGVKDVRAGALLDSKGHVGTKQTRDAEAMAFSPGGSEALIGFEGTNAFWVMPLGAARFQASREYSLPEMADWPANGGAESLVLLPSGKPLVIAEQASGDARPAIVIGGKPGGNLLLSYLPPRGMAPTDAVVAGDRLLVLNRSFSPAAGVAVAITEVALADISEGAILRGREIARLRPPLTVDNMEAIEARVEAGRTMIYLLSDDNFSRTQRTLLMKFELLPDR